MWEALARHQPSARAQLWAETEGYPIDCTELLPSVSTHDLTFGWSVYPDGEESPLPTNDHCDFVIVSLAVDRGTLAATAADTLRTDGEKVTAAARRYLTRGGWRRADRAKGVDELLG